MKAVASYSLITLGVIMCLVTGPMAFALSASPSGDGPVLVIGPPWDGGAAGVVQAAGGRIIGPTAAPLSVLATGASTEIFRQAGAWMVLDAAALNAICDWEFEG